MQSKLIQIFNFFTKLDKESQFDKLDEEYREFNHAYKVFRNFRSKENFENLILEVIDVAILLAQIGIVKFGYSLMELINMAKSKVNRTKLIISEMKSSGESYDEVRNRLR